MAETGMVEKVARAIAGEIDCVDWTAPDNTMSHPARLNAIALDAARAAIEAMREPTEEMISADALQLELVLAVKAAWAACDMIVEGPTSVASVACTAVLDHLKARAVIDAALKEGD